MSFLSDDKKNLARGISKRYIQDCAYVKKIPKPGRGQDPEVDYYGDAEAYRRRTHLAPLRRFGRYRMAVSNKLRFEVFKRDGFTCQYCGRKTPEVILEVDHIVPLKENGQDHIQNLVTSCFECNRGKAGTPLEQAFTRKDLKDDLYALAEKELQLKAYNRILSQQAKRRDKDLSIIERKYMEIVGETDKIFSDSANRSVRYFLSLFPLQKLLDALDIMAGKYDTGTLKRNATFSYFCGIVHRWRKEASDAKSNN